MAVLYLDCFSGVSGNMLLGALLDAGVPEERLREELGKLPVDGYELNVKQVSKQGISAVYVDVRVTRHQHHRHLADIIRIIDGANLDQSVKDDSKRIFMCLAEAEAKVHGTTPERIHFHEVGAVDAIVDIVGTVFGLHYLGVQQIYASQLNVGTGFVKCAHGTMPVPAPATAELLKGIPFYAGKIARELVTPTGAAVLATLGSGYGEMPEGFISHTVGYGAGTWDLDIPNVLRMHVGRLSAQGKPSAAMIVEANIDDLNPQIYSYVMDKLLDTGALDVWFTPVVMKKSRPATQLSVLIESTIKDQVVNIIFNETSTIGLRYYNVEREVADRACINVTVPWGQVRVKVSSYKGKECNIMPEYEDCRRLAESYGVPLKAVQQVALEAGAAVLKDRYRNG